MLAIKILITLDKVEHTVDNVNSKLKTLDGVFHIIDSTTDRIVLVTDKVVEGMTSLLSNLFSTKKKEKANKKATLKEEKKDE